MRAFILLAFALLSATAFGETTYRWIDPATGKTMITDTPPPGKAQRTGKITSPDDESGPQSYAVMRAAANFPVTLYTTPDCTTDCKNARDLLNRRGVPFTEKLIKTTEQLNELKALVGDAFVPSLKVGNQSSKGFLEENYNQLLDLAGYPKTAPYGSKPAPRPAP